MGRNVIRDFVYLDIERIRSFLAQASGGLTSERTLDAGHELGAEGSVEGGIPVFAKASGALDYRYLRSHSETKSLHDAIFEEFRRCMVDSLIDISDLDPSDWREDLFRDGAIVMTEGVLKVVDYRSAALAVQNLPNLMDTLTRVASVSTRVASVSDEQREKWQKSKSQIKNSGIRKFPDLLEQLYGDVVKVKVFPFADDSTSKVFVGTADKGRFRHDPATLTNLYGPVIDAGWSYVLQINRGQYHEPGELVSNTGSELEDMLETFVDALSRLGTLTQGVRFPAVAVTPIAIYREL